MSGFIKLMDIYIHVHVNTFQLCRVNINVVMVEPSNICFLLLLILLSMFLLFQQHALS